MAKGQRVVAYVDVTWYVPKRGYRVSLVFEGEKGHRPTGEWPNDGTGVMPWFWGPSFEDAQKACRRFNEQRGISKEDEFKIIAESMSLSTRPGRKAAR